MLDGQDVLAKRNLNFNDGRDGEVVTSPKPFGDFGLPSVQFLYRRFSYDTRIPESVGKGVIVC